MWEISLTNQITGSFYAFLTGMFFAFVYDIVKAVFLKNKYGTAAVFIKDILFSLFITFVTFMLLMARSNGAVRGYLIAFIGIGFFTFRLLLSASFLKLLFLILKITDKCFSKIKSLFLKFAFKLDAFDSKILGFLRKILKKCNKVSKNS